MRASIVLAVSDSVVLGVARQLLRHQGRSIVASTVENCQIAGAETVLVVTGTHHAVIERELADVECDVVHNAEWQDGIAGGISSGIRHLRAAIQDLQFVLVHSCDQPFTPPTHLERLFTASVEHGVTCATKLPSHACGLPAVFPQASFGSLINLPPQADVAGFINHGPTVLIRNGEAAIDLSTAADLGELGLSAR